MTSTVLTYTPSKGKVKIAYNDGSEEEDVYPKEIGFLMVVVEAPAKLTLLKSWDLHVKAQPEESDIEDIEDLQLEVQRVGQRVWYQFDHNGEPEYTEPARVAGKFIVRVKGSIEDSEHETEPTEEIEVRFPSAADIAADETVEAQRAADWTAASGPGGDHNNVGDGFIWIQSTKHGGANNFL